MSSVLNILYHGNCIDGWFSAYVVYDAKKDEYDDINFIPISPNQPRTWPTLEILKDTHVLLTDVMVSVETLKQWEENAKSVFCIDHHETTADALKGKANAIHDLECSSTLIAWKWCHPDEPIPEWVKQVNRIDLWTDITDDDRAIREILNPLAHECSRFLIQTEEFVTKFDDDEDYKKAILTKGHELLKQKDEALEILMKKGNVMRFTEENCLKWELSPEWVGKKGFIIDTTGLTLDSTEAGYIVLKNHPDAEFFCNYRKKSFKDKAGKQQYAYVYSGRARPGFDLTVGDFFKGHKTSAGANIVQGTRTIPFL